MHLTQPANDALSTLQNTQLSPMEEALFQAWTHANGIEKPDAEGNTVDYRGIYKGSNGMILPNGQLAQIANKSNAQSKLEQLLQEKIQAHTERRANEKLQHKVAGAKYNSITPTPHPVDNLGVSNNLSPSV